MKEKVVDLTANYIRQDNDVTVKDLGRLEFNREVDARVNFVLKLRRKQICDTMLLILLGAVVVGIILGEVFYIW